MKKPFAGGRCSESCIRAAFLPVVLAALLLGVYGVFLAQKIYFVSSDLGRHIRNGELIVSGAGREVLTTNFYSYTTPAFPALNHHWGTGVVFHGVWKIAGMAGLHVVFVAVRLAALWLFYDIARRRAGAGLAALAGALLMFALAERVEIRPEIFTYFLGGVFFWILSRVRLGDISPRWLWVLPVLEAGWVNLHIYFFLGPVIVGAFWAEFLLRRDARSGALAGVMALTAVATLLNPHGVAGAIAPFTIFDNYGLAIAENQGVFRILRTFGGISYVVFLVAAAVLSAVLALAVWRKRSGVAWSDVILAIGVTTMAVFAIRNLALFALFGLPVLAANVRLLLGPRRPPFEDRTRIVALASLAVLAVFVTTQDLRRLKYWNSGERGFGIEAGNDAAAEFFRTRRIGGPVFNNFDIGGYLIFHLWPGTKVFVDNRPEAYPESFFRDVYWPMLRNRDAWARREKEYGFNAIFFTHGDRSPAAQQFLIDRLNDPGWAVVFCDADNVIFVRRNHENAPLIASVSPRPPELVRGVR